MDKRKQRVLSILAVGSCILGWRLYVLFFEYLPDYRQRVPGTANAAPATPSPALQNNATHEPVTSVPKEDDPLVALLAAQQEIAERPWNDSPFIQPVIVTNDQPATATTAQPEEAPASPTLRFVGVSRTGQQWLAAVDGRIVRVGDALATGFEVKEIGKDWIVIEAAGWRHTYHLGSETPTVKRATE